MKGRVVVLAAIMVLSTAVLGRAMLRPRFPSSPAVTRGAGPSPTELARVLELTKAQQKQVTAILNEERAKEKARHLKEKDLRRQLREVDESATFDEQAARKLAVALASLDAERVVDHLKTRHRIDLLLSADQRAQAKMHRPERGEMRPPCPDPDEVGAAPAAPEGR